MNRQGKNLVFLICSIGLVLGCGPKNKAEAAAEPTPQQEALIMTDPEPTSQPEETLTPQQKEELEINEDNVMNPFPG